MPVACGESKVATWPLLANCWSTLGYSLSLLHPGNISTTHSGSFRAHISSKPQPTHITLYVYEERRTVWADSESPSGFPAGCPEFLERHLTHICGQSCWLFAFRTHLNYASPDEPVWISGTVNFFFRDWRIPCKRILLLFDLNRVLFNKTNYP